MKVVLTRRAVFQRISRVLAPGQKLKVAKGAARIQLGELFLVDGKQVIEHHINLKKFVIALGTLQSYEDIEERF